MSLCKLCRNMRKVYVLLQIDDIYKIRNIDGLWVKQITYANDKVEGSEGC